jgi:hypothetical protein
VIAAMGLARRASSTALAFGVAAAIAAAAPEPARATTATIERSAANLLLFPLDVALSPYVATKATYVGWKSSNDTKAVKYFYPVFGVPWMISVNVGASCLRGLAGALELLPGLVLIPFKADLDPIFDLSEDNPSLYDSGEESPIRIKFGVDYVSPSEL